MLDESTKSMPAKAKRIPKDRCTVCDRGFIAKSQSEFHYALTGTRGMGGDHLDIFPGAQPTDARHRHDRASVPARDRFHLVLVSRDPQLNRIQRNEA